MSQSQSRSSLGQPRSTTALYQSASTIAHLPPSPQQVHTTTLSHKLRHMFDSSEYAVFLSNVRIHELGNVPQLEGEFAVRWKFRGRRPRGKVGESGCTIAGDAADGRDGSWTKTEAVITESEVESTALLYSPIHVLALPPLRLDRRHDNHFHLIPDRLTALHTLPSDPQPILESPQSTSKSE